MKNLILCLLFVLPISVSAVEIPRTEFEAQNRLKMSNNGGFLPIPTSMAEVVYRSIYSLTDDNKLATTLSAIAVAESGLIPTAKNWNCKYGKEYMSCKKEDRYLAFSVDCGILQLNFKGLHCPEWTYDMHENIKGGLKIYKEQGLNAWVVYKKGTYKQHLSLVDS